MTWSRARWVVSVAVPPVAAFVLVAMTVRQLDFLREQPWSPVRRTRILWPSLLAVGPQGWVVGAVFVLLGVAVLACAIGLLRSPERAVRLAGCCLVASSLGLVLVAAPTDLPPTSDPTWHSVVHDVAYPPIVIGAFVAAFLLARSRSAGVARTASRLLLPALLVTFAATGPNAFAQLSRYVFFFLLLVWFEIVAADRRAGRAGISS